MTADLSHASRILTSRARRACSRSLGSMLKPHDTPYNVSTLRMNFINICAEITFSGIGAEFVVLNRSRSVKINYQ